MTPPTPRPWLIAAALVAVFGGFAGYRLAPWRESPRQAWEDISAAAAAGDYGAVYDQFDPPSQSRMSPDLRRFAAEADRAAGVTDGSGSPCSATAGPTCGGSSCRPTCWRSGRPATGRRSGSPVPEPTSNLYFARYNGRWCLSYGADEPPR